uniref:Uncharacterized protein n=1 Tax=Arundo donax TaxID=35708 RepID=A0A0A8ZHN6_ARUDO
MRYFVPCCSFSAPTLVTSSAPATSQQG